MFKVGHVVIYRQRMASGSGTDAIAVITGIDYSELGPVYCRLRGDGWSLEKVELSDLEHYRIGGVCCEAKFYCSL